MDAGIVTVAEALVAWLGSGTPLCNALQDVEKRIGTEELQHLLQYNVPHASTLLVKGKCVSATSLAGEKFTKALASEFACLNFPAADTAKVTNVTRVLSGTETLCPVLKDYYGFAISRRDVFMPFLALVVYASGIKVASCLLLPVFQSILRDNEYAISLPSILSAFFPGLAHGVLSHKQQIMKLLGALEKRGVHVRKEVEGHRTDGTCELYTVRVFYEDAEQSCETGRRLTDFYAIVTEQGRKFQSNRKSEKRKERSSPTSSPKHMKMWMYEVHRLLRFQSPYKDLMGGDLERVVQSNGWMPLSEIQRLLGSRTEATRRVSPKEEDLQHLFEQHDGFQRFQVGVCDVKGSSFEGQLCARALYAHRCGHSISESIFRDFAHVTDPSTCPPLAWVPVEKPRKDKITTEPFKLYEDVLFVYAFPQESFDEFLRYREDVPPEEQYDEKLSKKAAQFFLEFCLRAAVRDEQMRVVQMPQRADAAVHWAIFPSRKESADSDGIEIPRYFFTGHVRILGGTADDIRATETGGQSSDLSFGKISALAGIDPDGFSAEEVERIFGTDRTAGGITGSGNGGMKDNGERCCMGGKSSAVKELDLISRDGRRTTAALNMDDAKVRVLEMCADPEKFIALVSFPKWDANGGPLLNRRTDIANFKKWVSSLGLLCRRAEDDDTEGVYEIRRRALLDIAFVRKIAEELELKDFPDLRVLQQALTRECESPNANYEMMEFIGDAIMDFLVSFDSFLLGEPWNLDVVQLVCRNEVLSHLIPDELSRRLSHCYTGMDLKVKADMMEAILGAVYKRHMGLDRVRQLLRHFFKRIPCVRARESDAATAGMLARAEDACPYLRHDGDSLEEKFRYDCVALIDHESAMRYALVKGRPFEGGHHSHYALTPFNRIQEKACATHFTTGPVFSYRLIPCIDTPELFNRILTLFDSGSIAFVNEIVTEDTHLAIDFDGADVRSFGVLALIWQWFQKRFVSSSSMLLMDCTGLSVVTKKLKWSHHIHFPQAVICLRKLQSDMEDLRKDIVQHLGRGSLLGEVVGFKTEEAQTGPITVIGRVVLSTRYMMSVLSEAGIRPMRRCWAFMNLRDLCQLGQACRKLRYSVFSHLCAVAQLSGVLASICGVHKKYDFKAKSDSAEYAHYVLIRVLFASSAAQGVVGELLLAPANEVSVVSEGATYVLSDVVRKPQEEKNGDNGVKLENEKMMTAKEFSNYVTLQREGGLFSTAYWNRVVDAGLATSRKLRMYLNDKCDMKYFQEYRPLFLDALYNVGGERRTVRPDRAVIQQRSVVNKTAAAALNVRSEGDPKQQNDEETYPLELAHASVLRLASLRSPTYRDVNGLLRSAWTEGCNADATFADFTHIEAVDDRLPSFEAYQRCRDPQRESEWTLWANGVCGMLCGDAVTEKDSDTAKTTALQPTYWTHDSSQQQAKLWIAGEVVLIVGPSKSLYEALTLQRGMETMARLLLPSILVKDSKFVEGWLTAYSPRVFPLFLPFLKKARPPSKKHNERVVPSGDCGIRMSGGSSSSTAIIMNSQLSNGTTPHPKDVPALFNCSQTAPQRGPRKKEKVCLLSYAMTGDPLVGEHIYPAIRSALRGQCRPFLIVTANTNAFSWLSVRFPCVVSPEYFKPSTSKGLRYAFCPVFCCIFVIDDTIEPYSKDVVGAIWKRVTEGHGRLFAATAALQNCLEQR
ncbi:putative RNase III domain protein [Trypanosoma grayi]|uniref:putative RNase III domain protein n=1 Tax=Trypanosoma grayi TaxID=71804 RepID=UPI0004F43880|nr:putative RNase III domain protein [Trypanosoma grayi]KEG12841.1 putative RNase III domain protein [Trypanosoma grayi]